MAVETGPQQAFNGFFVPQETPQVDASKIAQFGSLHRLDAARGFARELAASYNISPFQVTEQVRLAGAQTAEGKTAVQRSYHERIVMVSDLHGADDAIVEKLHALVENPPTIVILGGDVAGNKDLEVLQRLYYNHLTNHTRNEILKTNPGVSDADLLAYGGTKPPYEGYTVKKGFLELRTKELTLEGLPKEQIEETLNGLTDERIASEVRRYADFVHYGHYASNLLPPAVDTLKDGIKDNAARIAEPLKKLIQAGTQVAIVEGNWDPSPPIAFERGLATAKRLPPQKQPFDVQGYFKSEKIPYFTGMGTLQTKTALFVLLPFDQLIRFSKMTPDEVTQYATPTARAIQRARNEGQQVIVVQHGEAAWKPHNVTNPNSSPSGEHAQVLDGFAKVVKSIQPDEILHGHFHDVFTDEQGVKRDPNTKYALTISENGVPQVVEALQEDNAENTVVSFVPLQRTAEIFIPIKDSRRRGIQGFGGVRQPAKVQ